MVGTPASSLAVTRFETQFGVRSSCSLWFSLVLLKNYSSAPCTFASTFLRPDVSHCAKCAVEKVSSYTSERIKRLEGDQ